MVCVLAIPAGLSALTGNAATQRAALLAAGGKLVVVGKRYYSVSIPGTFYSASKPTVVFNLHGTAAYPEAEWTDWGATMDKNGTAFIALAGVVGTPGAATDVEIYTLATQILQEVGANRPNAAAVKGILSWEYCGEHAMFDYMAAAPPTSVTTVAKGDCLLDAVELALPTLFRPCRHQHKSPPRFAIVTTLQPARTSAGQLMTRTSTICPPAAFCKM